MHPILFQSELITIYTYGFCIALGAVLGGLYMWRQGSRQFGLTFDQANTLFVLLIVAGAVGGKLFMLFPNPSYYLNNPSEILSGSGFVFYGSLLTAIPVMLWYFRKNKIPTLAMLDIMAVVTCIVHGFGRLGCFGAGCCYGVPTDSIFGVVFSDSRCQAHPLHVPIHPTQLYEGAFIFCLLIFLFAYKAHKKFDGQLFILYLIMYATGRGVLETLRGDLSRGFVIGDWLSTSQFISILIIAVAIYFYVKLNRRATLTEGRE